MMRGATGVAVRGAFRYCGACRQRARAGLDRGEYKRAYHKIGTHPAVLYESTSYVLTIHDVECTVERMKYTEQCHLTQASYWDECLCENNSVSTGRQNRS